MPTSLSSVSSSLGRLRPTQHDPASCRFGEVNLLGNAAVRPEPVRRRPRTRCEAIVVSVSRHDYQPRPASRHPESEREEHIDYLKTPVKFWDPGVKAASSENHSAAMPKTNDVETMPSGPFRRRLSFQKSSEARRSASDPLIAQAARNCGKDRPVPAKCPAQVDSVYSRPTEAAWSHQHPAHTSRCDP